MRLVRAGINLLAAGVDVYRNARLLVLALPTDAADEVQVVVVVVPVVPSAGHAGFDRETAELARSDKARVGDWFAVLKRVGVRVEEVVGRGDRLIAEASRRNAPASY